MGGFLGIGEKDVAVPFKTLEFLSAEQAQAADNSNRNVSTTGSTATGTAAPGTPATGAAPSTSMATTNTAAKDQNKPERVMLRMTKAELQAAPVNPRLVVSVRGAGESRPSTEPPEALPL